MFTGYTDQTVDVFWGIRFNNDRAWFAEHARSRSIREGKCPCSWHLNLPGKACCLPSRSLAGQRVRLRRMRLRVRRNADAPKIHP